MQINNPLLRQFAINNFFTRKRKISNPLLILDKLKVSDIALLGVVTVFIPVIPIDAETQPLIIVALIAFLFPLVTRRILFQGDVDFVAVRCLIIALGMSCIVSALGGFHASSGAAASALSSMLRYSIPLMFYVAMRDRDLRPSPALVRALIIIHCVLALLYFAGVASFLKVIFSRYSSSINDVRGFSFLAPEPSYAASYLFCVFMACFISEVENRKTYCWVTLGLIFITKSVTGVIYIALGAVLLLSGTQFVAALIGVVSFVVINGMALFASESSRTAQLVSSISALGNTVLAHPVLAFIIAEPSGSVRMLVNGYAISIGMHSVVGYGIGSFFNNFMPIARMHGADLFDYNLALAEYYAYGLPTPPQSAFAALAFEIGVFSLPYLVLFYALMRNLSLLSKKWFVGITLSLMFLLIQSEISNPAPFYILILLATSSQKAPDMPTNRKRSSMLGRMVLCVKTVRNMR